MPCHKRSYFKSFEEKLIFSSPSNESFITFGVTQYIEKMSVNTTNIDLKRLMSVTSLYPWKRSKNITKAEKLLRLSQ